jgi:hypothetical protein
MEKIGILLLFLLLMLNEIKKENLILFTFNLRKAFLQFRKEDFNSRGESR